MLIKNNMLKSHKFILDYNSQFAIINSCQKIKIFARFIMKSYSQIKRVIKIKSTLTLPLNIIINISISYNNILFDNRDFLFESKLSTFLDKEDEVYAYVINTSITFG